MIISCFTLDLLHLAASYAHLAPLYPPTATADASLFIAPKQAAPPLLPLLHAAEGTAGFTSQVRNDRWNALLIKDGGIHREVGGVIDNFRASMELQFLS